MEHPEKTPAPAAKDPAGETPAAENPAPGERGSGWLAASVVAVAALLVGGLLVAQFRPASVPQEAPTTTAVRVPSPIPAAGREDLKALYTEPDPAVQAWHDKVAPVIGTALAILSKPPVTSAAGQQSDCNSLRMLADGLRDAEQAPRDDVAVTFGVWVDELAAAVTQCLDPERSLDDPEALREIQQALGMTSLSFDYFIRTISKYVDLAG